MAHLRGLTKQEGCRALRAVAPRLLLTTGMTHPDEHEATPPERQEVPEGREPPVMGPRKARGKVKPLKGEPAIDRPYEPGGDKRPPDDPWQDPGGPEPANG
jgi:hypothetical protein